MQATKHKKKSNLLLTDRCRKLNSKIKHEFVEKNIVSIKPGRDDLWPGGFVILFNVGMSVGTV